MADAARRELPEHVAAVLFDLDGTLADTAGDLAAALNAVRRDEGLPPMSSRLLRVHASAGARGMLGAGMGVTPEDPRYERLRMAFLDHYATLLADTTRLFDGIDALLDALDRRSVRWGVVTNKATRFTDRVMGALGLADRASIVVSGDTTAFAKPHPEPLLHAARSLGVDARACIYLGDDLRDVQAGNAAGMATVVARWGYLGDGQDAAAWPAVAGIDAPLDLLSLLVRG